MDSFKTWALSLCGALIVTSIFRILMSGSSLNKSINIFLSMFIFLYSILPLNDVFDDIDFTFEVKSETKSYKNYYKDGYEQIVIEAIKNICDKNNVSVIQIDLDSYTDDNGYYCINKLEIDIDSSSKKDFIENELKEKLGFEVTVY